MKISNESKFNYELEWIDSLKNKANGHINDKIILYCDYSGRTKKSLILFLDRLFEICGIEFNTKDKEFVTNHFNNNINYFSIKEYFLNKIDELRSK